MKRFSMAAAVTVLALNLSAVFRVEAQAAPAATNWGEPVDGLSVRLTSEMAQWPFSKPAILKFSVRNQGKETVLVAQNQLGGQLEAEGIWFSWTNVFNGPMVELAPGAQLDNIPINFDTRWENDSVFFPFGPGGHTARFTPLARQKGGQAIRAVSNPVDFDVLLPNFPGLDGGQAGPAFPAENASRANAAPTDIRARSVDDETGSAVTNIWLQSGTTNAEKPSDFAWSQNYQGPIVTDSQGRFVVQSQGTDQVWRVLADGYQPQTIPAQPAGTNAATTDLVVRLKRAQDLRGVVLDYRGQPVPGARVSLASAGAQGGRGRPNPKSGNSSTTTDASGRFALRPMGGFEMKVVVTSSDGHLVWPVHLPETGQELKITLPQPASLLVRYDIAGDPPDSTLLLTLITREREMPLWENVNSQLSPTVPNHKQTSLTNLTPGTYLCIRFKTLPGDAERGYTNILDHQTLLLEPGWTQDLDLARLTGYPIQGQVTMRDQAEVPPGSISVYPIGGIPRGKGADGAIFGKDGHFQTSLLSPGTYTVQADARALATGAANRTGMPDFIAWSTITVTADAAPAPMKIELLPYSTSNNLSGPPTTTNRNAARPRPVARPQAAIANPGAITVRLLDDETGEPIVDFLVQLGTPADPAKPNDVFWNSYFSGNEQSPGIFTASRNQIAPYALRFTAPGYVPQILTPDALVNALPAGLEVRLKRGQMVQGVVLDAAGRPVSGARVLLVTGDRVYLRDGKFQYGMPGGASTNTDDAGRFTLRGGGASAERVVVISPDGHFIWPAAQPGPGQEVAQQLVVVLPKPATLIVRYDIPGDAPEAKTDIYLRQQDKEMPLWTNIVLSLSLTVSNGGQVVLTNLTPGSYYLSRNKTVGTQGATVETQTNVVEPGQTRYANLVHTNGQRLRGQIIGLDQAKASGGYLYVKSAEATGIPWPQRSRNEQNEYKYPTFEITQFGADGNFQTAMLKPGDYTVIADVYPPQDRSANGQGGPAGPYRNNAPDYIGVVKVTVSSDPMPPMSIQLVQAPYVDIAGSGVDDETGRPIPDLSIESGQVNPDKPGEILWQQGYQGISLEGSFSLWGLKDGAALRFQADGYLPEVITRNQIIASRQTANFQVRMKHGGELRGMVLDHAGWPVPGAIVYLAPVELGFVRLGPLGWSSSGNGPAITNWGHSHAVTDPAGRFSMRGIGTNETRLIAVSPDDYLIQPVPVAGPVQDLKITLPEPASLIVDYDIPGDVPKADFTLTLNTNELESPIWKYITSTRWGAAPNGGQIVLSNLMPGVYDFSRPRQGDANNRGRPIVFGDPQKTVHTDHQRVVLQSGQTQQVHIVRSAGQRVEGQVTGLPALPDTAEAFLCVASSTAIRSRADFMTNKLDPCFDAVTLPGNGHFQTAVLEPGTYTLVAEVYLEDDASDDEDDKDVPGDQPILGGGFVFFRPQKLTLIGSATVTVPTNAPPPPVRIGLRPLKDAGAAP